MWVGDWGKVVIHFITAALTMTSCVTINTAPVTTTQRFLLQISTKLFSSYGRVTNYTVGLICQIWRQDVNRTAYV